METRRVIGVHRGGEGPLLICTAGLHGNEPAGVRALEYVFKMLEVEPITNPDFDFHGTLVGLAGNLGALREGRRFLACDMNRLFTPGQMERIRATAPEERLPEEREATELLEAIEPFLDEHPADRPAAFLDIHTTTADGGIFGIPSRDPESIRLAAELHAPVILGMLDGLSGTTLHWFSREERHRDIVSLAFEAGQHDDRYSVNRAIAAIIGALRGMGMVRPEDVENVHDKVLLAYSEGLPTVCELLEVYRVRTDRFRMEPGYRNFQPVSRGELLARDGDEEVRASADARILMPRYQPQGEDGFFLLNVLVD